MLYAHCLTGVSLRAVFKMGISSVKRTQLFEHIFYYQLQFHFQ